MISSFLAFLSLLNILPNDGATTNSLSDCNMFITKFSQTCNPTEVAASSIDTIAGVTVPCTSRFTSDRCSTIGGGAIRLGEAQASPELEN
jgi:hypothetical protein